MAGVVGSRRDLIFVISELYYKVGGRHFVVGSKIAGCQHILLAPVVRRVDNAIQPINHYPVDSVHGCMFCYHLSAG